MTDPRYVTKAPIGRWLRRTDESIESKAPVLAYGMESCVLVLWTDGTHTLHPTGTTFPASNWVIWEEIG